MNDNQIQILRYIHLSDGQSIRQRGLHKAEVAPLRALGYVCETDEGATNITQRGKDYLSSINARTFGNPLWDTPTFAKLLDREPLN